MIGCRLGQPWPSGPWKGRGVHEPWFRRQVQHIV